jgi:hypothetical protein
MLGFIAKTLSLSSSLPCGTGAVYAHEQLFKQININK